MSEGRAEICRRLESAAGHVRGIAEVVRRGARRSRPATTARRQARALGSRARSG